LDAEILFFNIAYTWYTGTRWCTSDLHMVTVDI